MICVLMNAGNEVVIGYVNLAMTIAQYMKYNISRQNYNDYMSITRRNNIISTISNGNGSTTITNVTQLLMHSITQHNGPRFVITLSVVT